jgi:hypothetical protein
MPVQMLVFFKCIIEDGRREREKGRKRGRLT